MFANPRGILVLPAPSRALALSARGGRARAGTTTSLVARKRGEGDELRELRDHVPGDAFKRIAWKASARRGTLLVRDTEQETQDVVWVFLDASAELSAGDVGMAPLDRSIDDAAAIFATHLRRGRAGLYCYATRPLSRLAPATGLAALRAAEEALVSCTLIADADRSEDGEAETLHRVLEHLRPLDPMSLSGLSPSDVDAIAVRADALKHRAPFTLPLPHAPTLREARLRHYLAAFGIESPPKNEGSTAQAEFQLAVGLRSLLDKKEKPPTSVYVVAPIPRDTELLAPVLRALRKARVRVEWRPAPHSLPAGRGYDAMVSDALARRLEVEDRLASRALRKLGVLIKPLRDLPAPIRDEPKEHHDRSA